MERAAVSRSIWSRSAWHRHSGVEESDHPERLRRTKPVQDSRTCWRGVRKFGSIARAVHLRHDASEYLYEAQKAGKNIMFEAQLGALRDIDFGILPLYVIFLLQTRANFGLCRRGHSGQPMWIRHGRHRQGLLHLRRRRPLHGGDGSARRRSKLRAGRRRIRRFYRPSASRRPHRSWSPRATAVQIQGADRRSRSRSSTCFRIMKEIPVCVAVRR